jgi:adenosylmethionine-8-amino-7-oxononanoate aminotransferase
MEIKYWSPGEQEKTVTRTHGYWVEYSNGTTHLDIQCGNMAYILGYANQPIADAVASNTVNFIRGNTGETAEPNDALVREICESGNWAAVTWAVSGSDAVEAAVAMNDSYWAARGESRDKILSFSMSYHGTTMLAKHLRGEYPGLGRAVLVDSPNWQYAYQQLGQEQLTLNKIRAQLKKHPDIGCVLLETVSWAVTMAPYSTKFWQDLRAICTENNVLMIVDDVAFCWGTNGTMFGYEPYGIQPDICAIGKSLTGGYSPLGAAVCTEAVRSTLNIQAWMHGHTWQPNMAGVAAALNATQQIQSLLHRVPEIEHRLKTIADELDLNSRGANTYITYDFDQEVSLSDLNDVGFAASLPGYNSVKVFAPLTADDEYFDRLKTGLQRLSKKPVYSSPGGLA